MSLYKRYCLTAIRQCVVCGKISLYLSPVGGAPGDPPPENYTVPEPGLPPISLQPLNLAEPEKIAQELITVAMKSLSPSPPDDHRGDKYTMFSFLNV